MILSTGKLLIDDTPNNVLKNLAATIIYWFQYDKSAIELKKELQTLNNFKYIDINNNMFYKLKSTSDHLSCQTIC